MLFRSKIWWAANNGGALWSGSILSYNTLTDSLKEEHFFKRTHIGQWPIGGPFAIGPDSCIYGSTTSGGTASNIKQGNLFKYNPRDSSYQVLYEFTGNNNLPLNGLIIDSNYTLIGVCAKGIFY